MTGDALLRRVCEETLDFMLRELRQDEGAFASALDADSEGVEGKFYVWRRDEVPAEAARVFGMTAEGNWEGVNIPVRATADPPNLAELKAELLALRAAAGAAGARRQAADVVERARDLGAGRRGRGARPRGLPRRGARARRTSCSTTMRDGEGRLLRTYNRGQARLSAYLEDHGYLLEALLTLYEATFEDRWFAAARELADETIFRFGDPERGGFFIRPRTTTSSSSRGASELEDNPIPSGQSAVAYGLLRLAALTGEDAYAEQARDRDAPAGRRRSRAIRRRSGTCCRRSPSSTGRCREIALVGDDGAPSRRSCARASGRARSSPRRPASR